MPAVFFQNADYKLALPNKRKLKLFIACLFLEYGIRLSSLAIIFCSDEYLLSLNRQFLQHDYYTDILTFDLSKDQDAVGEIYISVERVKENAIQLKISFEQEIHRIIFHGVLHLCGFSDKSLSQRKKMTELENIAIQNFLSFT